MARRTFQSFDSTCVVAPQRKPRVQSGASLSNTVVLIARFSSFSLVKETDVYERYLYGSQSQKDAT